MVIELCIIFVKTKKLDEYILGEISYNRKTIPTKETQNIRINYDNTR